MIHRPRQGLALGQQSRHVGLSVVTAVDGEARFAFADPHGCGSEPGKRLTDQNHQSLDHQRRVVFNQFHLVGLDRIVIHQVIPETGAAVVVRKGQHDLMPLQPELAS